MFSLFFFTKKNILIIKKSWQKKVLLNEKKKTKIRKKISRFSAIYKKQNKKKFILR